MLQFLLDQFLTKKISVITAICVTAHYYIQGRRITLPFLFTSNDYRFFERPI